MTNQPAPLTPETVSAILRDPDSPYYPSRITVFCDECGTEETGEFMVSEDMTGEQRLAVARKHLADTKGWEHTEAGDDFCPEHAGSPTEEPPALRLTALTAYAASIAAANVLTTRYGLVPMGFGLTATAGTYAAGAALLLRDVVHDACGPRWVIAGIGGGALLTALTAPSLVIASAVAFLLAELLDMAVYTPLRKRGWARAALISGIVGAVVDTYVFLALAGFPITAASTGGQLVGKAVWATALPILTVVAVRQVRRGLVSRHPVGA